jgi:hypothetical protein
MDVHGSIPDGATATDVAGAHAADLRVQERYGVRYLNYWVDERGGGSSVWSRRRAPTPRTRFTAKRTASLPTRSIQSCRGEHHDKASELVRAVAARDLDGMVGPWLPDARFRYLIPPGPGGHGRGGVAAKYLSGSAMQMRSRSGHSRPPVSDPDICAVPIPSARAGGWEVVERQTFLDVDAEGQITSIDLLCSGFRPAKGPEG